MRQVKGKGAELLAAIAVANGAPVGDQAGRLVMETGFDWILPLPTCWEMQVIIENTADPQAAEDYEAELYLWGREAFNSVWGQVGIKDGQVNDGTTIAGNGITVSRYFMYANLDLFQDLWLQLLNPVGADFSVRATLFPIWLNEIDGISPS